MLKLLPMLIALSIVGQNLACKGNGTHRVKREGPDFVGMGMQVIATGVDIMQQGGAMKFNVSAKSGNENDKNF